MINPTDCCNAESFFLQSSAALQKNRTFVLPGSFTALIRSRDLSQDVRVFFSVGSGKFLNSPVEEVRVTTNDITARMLRCDCFTSAFPKSSVSLSND